MAVLYITSQDIELGIIKNSIVIKRDDNVVDEIELINVDYIVIYGNAQFSTQLVKGLAKNGKTISLLTTDGRFVARIMPKMSKDIELRIAQNKAAENTEKSIKLAKEFVRAKIINCIGLTQRFEGYRKLELDSEQDKLKQFVEKINDAQTLNELVGIEGSATKVYFEAFAKIIAGKWKFTKRTKHPPKDPVNAMLSLAYTLLGNEIGSLAEALGFDPYLGFLHKIRYGRQSLALDILEIFRAPIADRLVIRLVNKEIIDEDDFKVTKNGYRLKKFGLKKFLREYERLMLSTLKDPETNEKVSARRLIQLQVERLKNYIKFGGKLWIYDFRKY